MKTRIYAAPAVKGLKNIPNISNCEDLNKKIALNKDTINGLND